jgi:hypothetical protein
MMRKEVRDKLETIMNKKLEDIYLGGGLNKYIKKN